MKLTLLAKKYTFDNAIEFFKQKIKQTHGLTATYNPQPVIGTTMSGTKFDADFDIYSWTLEGDLKSIVKAARRYWQIRTFGSFCDHVFLSEDIQILKQNENEIRMALSQKLKKSC